VKLVQTVFLDNQRIDQSLVDTDHIPMQATGDKHLWVMRRRPAPWDWVDGVFVGDHDEDEDDPHVHGEPG
jgi:hypothetical protein